MGERFASGGGSVCWKRVSHHAAWFVLYSTDRGGWIDKTITLRGSVVKYWLGRSLLLFEILMMLARVYHWEIGYASIRNMAHGEVSPSFDFSYRNTFW